MITPLQKFRAALSCLWVFPLFFLSLQPVLGQNSATESLNLAQWKSLQAEIQINAGTLHLSTHDHPDADMHFLYSREGWRPEVVLDQEKSGARLFVRQAEGKNFNMKNDERNDWEIKLPRSLAGELRIRIGAGEGNLDLHGAKLERLELKAGAGDFKVNLSNTSLADLEINAGVGSMALDLSGSRNNNLKAGINGGIGDLKLLLPAGTGVRVKVNGLGSIGHTGFQKQDGYYVNEAYGKTRYSLDITVNGGLGSVELALD
jgi:hypothetical protein